MGECDIQQLSTDVYLIKHEYKRGLHPHIWGYAGVLISIVYISTRNGQANRLHRLGCGAAVLAAGLTGSPLLYKKEKKMKKTGMIVGALALAVAANAATVTYTGLSGASWSDGANWSDGAVPDGSDTAQINSGSTVNFNYGSGWPSANAIAVNVDGTVTAANPVRAWQTVWNIGSTGTLDLGVNWLSPWGGGAAFNFDSGATLNMSGNIQFGGAGADATLGFNLDSAGFDTLSAGALFFGGTGTEYDNQTIKADMAAYTGGLGTIVLMDLDSANGVTDTIFQGLNLVVANAGAYAGSSLSFNETTSAIELDVIPEPATIGMMGLGALAMLAVRRQKLY